MIHQSEEYFPVVELLGFQSLEDIKNNLSDIYTDNQVDALSAFFGRHIQSWHVATKFFYIFFYI